MTSKINWAEPRLYAAALKHKDDLAFLYSGHEFAKKSYLAWDADKNYNDISTVKSALEKGEKLFGYFGYGVRNQLEELPHNDSSFIDLPDIHFSSFKNIIEFDHAKKTITILAGEIASLKKGNISDNEISVKKTSSNMSGAEYLEKAAKVIEKIKNGDIYQANLTRKFFGEFAGEVDAFEIFYRLSEISPAEYSAFMKFNGKAIISASPERFMKVENGKAITSPIKGTMPLSNSAADLANSEKDKAENLMIVDLMRNDLSRSCDNVKVDELFKVITHKKYHHMHSTITADVQTNALDVILKSFPPGSMTGTPKIEATKLCSDLEQIERSVYSGVLGWFDGLNSCDFSVVIRTIITDGKRFEFQAGGAIVYDSTPERELDEINTKIAAIKEVMNL